MAKATDMVRSDPVMLGVTLALAGLGLVMVLSASSLLAEEHFGDPYHYFKNQAVFAALGLMLMALLSRVPYQLLCRLSYPLLFLTLAALALVLVPGLGREAGGATRWLKLGPVSGQPSEAAKLALVIYLSYSLAAKRDRIREFAYGLLPHLMVLGALAGLIMAEPDFGTVVIMAAIAMVMFFTAGVPVSHLVSLAVLSAPAVYLLIARSSYRLERISAFMSPWDDPLGKGYHIIHSFMAFASGGLTGTGPGGSGQKLFFLPEPHTDFIFSIVGEELGFIGVTTVATLFMILLIRGIRAALNAVDLEGTYLALGLTLIVGLQAFTNMAVVVGLLPTKGLILPFFSYGGSALVTTFAAMGILLNVAGQAAAAAPGPAAGGKPNA